HEPTSRRLAPIAEVYAEAVSVSADRVDRDVPQLDARVSSELFSTDAPEVRRVEPVARQEAVHGMHRRVSRLSGVANKGRALRAAEHQRGVEACRTGARNHDVNHHPSLSG